MIGSLRGALLDRGDGTDLTIEVSGIGYRVTVAPSCAAASARVGSTVFVWVHTYVKEDALVLYGFDAVEERSCFEALLGAHGVGPSLAMAVLGVHNPVALSDIIGRHDVDALVMVPGIGRKTAQRLIIDLASRFTTGEAVVAIPGAAAGAAIDVVREALVGLGYGPDEIRTALSAMNPEKGADPGILLRRALRELSRTGRGAAS